MITDEQAEQALDDLLEFGTHYAQHKASQVALEARRSALKAKLMCEYAQDGYSAIGAQEREAYADPRYAELLDQMESVTLEVETWAARRERARMVIEVWRTQQATQRSQKI